MHKNSKARSLMDEQLLMTAEEAAHALRVGRTTLFALIKTGDLHAVHIGRSCRLTRAELQRFVGRLDEAASPPTPVHRVASSTEPARQPGLFVLDPLPPDAA